MGSQLEQGQVGFIKGILRPLWQGVAALLPELEPFIDRINENLAHWELFAQHKKSQILLHVVEESQKPGITFNAGDVIVEYESVWDKMGKGAFFGEVGAFKGIPRTANSVAKTA